MLVILSVFFFDKIKIDDPVGAISVHGVNGLWGVLAVGLFAVGEALYVASRRHHTEEKLEPIRGSLWMTREDWSRSWKPWLRGTLFGFPIGAMPAGGAEIPTFLSYSTE